MVRDVEDLIREQKGREYVVMPGTGVAIPDFLRQEVQIPYRDSTQNISAEELSLLIKNSRFPSAHRMAGGKHTSVCITGEVDFPLWDHDETTCIGVNSAIFSSTVTHAFILDPRGEVISQLRNYRNLPLGIFDVRTHNRTINEWERRSRVGIYRSRPGVDGCDSAVLKGIQCQLQADPLSAAIHYAAKYMGALDIYLHQADRSYPEPLGGIPMIQLGGRWILPERKAEFDTLEAISIILQRNGVNLYITEGTMVKVSGAQMLNKEALASEILSKSGE